MQTYKSSGDVERATKFYNDYSQVPDSYKIVKDIVKKHKRPGVMKEFANIVLPSEDKFNLIQTSPGEVFTPY
jgi:hypothetical protein